MSLRQNRPVAVVAVLALAGGLSGPGPALLRAEGSPNGPPTGSVGLRELVELALRNDPGLVALRKNIPVEEARKRAAVQWRDPELRLGMAREGDVQLDEPYSRRGTVTESFGSRSGREESGGPNGDAARNDSSTGSRTTTFRERVIPGRVADRVIRTETERSRTESSTRDRDNTGRVNRESSESEVFRSTSDELFFHGRDRLARDETSSVRVRFWIPKPAEMKALVSRAAREVDLANYQVTAAEREVILEVREQYEELQFLFRKLEASRRQIAIIEEHAAKERELLDAGGAFTLDMLSFEDIKIPGMKLAVDAAAAELAAAKRTLAARVGLSDGSRIRVTDNLLRSAIDLRGTDLDYLTLMAFAHRGEVGILRHEQAIVEAELDVVKSKRIPWFSFVDAAYAQDSSGGTHTNDEYGVQVGVVLPLFSWLAKDEEVINARLEAYYAMLEANQRNIANEVAEAFRSVDEANRHRARTAAAIAQHSRAIAEREKTLEASEDLAAREGLRYDIEVELLKLHEYRLSADRLFNQSLIRLERALGADLDQVLHVEYEPLGGPSPPPAEESAPPSSPPATRAIPVPEAAARQVGEGTTRTKGKGLFRFGKE